MCMWCKGTVLFSLPGVVLGDPHVVTFDGLSYTFNGRGEFYLVSSPDKKLSVQARTEQVKLKNGESGFDMKALFVSPLATTVTPPFCSKLSSNEACFWISSLELIFWIGLVCFVFVNQLKD